MAKKDKLNISPTSDSFAKAFQVNPNNSVSSAELLTSLGGNIFQPIGGDNSSSSSGGDSSSGSSENPTQSSNVSSEK